MQERNRERDYKKNIRQIDRKTSKQIRKIKIANKSHKDGPERDRERKKREMGRLNPEGDT